VDRRCPDEQLTISIFGDFLRNVWPDKITFGKLNLTNPAQVPIRPNAVIEARSHEADAEDGACRADLQRPAKNRKTRARRAAYWPSFANFTLT
jgi:hypothetical protein